MYKLMVVEDEKIIRKGIIQGIKWNELGFEVVAEGKNGVEALEKLKESKVDVVITDIKMPIMDGIELSKQIRQKYEDIEIVILSGFSEFEYAREAITFNAYEYLLKPTKKAKLIEIFQRIKIKLDIKKEEQEMKRSKNIILNEGYEKLRKEFLIGILDGDKEILSNVKEGMNKLELDLDNEIFTSAVIKINTKSTTERIENAWNNDNKIIMYTYKNIVDEILKDVGTSNFVIRDINEIDIIFSFDTQKQQNDQMIKVLNRITKSLNDIIFATNNININIGVGLTYSSILQINKSYEQAKKALEKSFFKSDKYINIFSSNLESEFENQWIKNCTKEISSIVNNMIKGDIKNLENLINSMFDSFINQKINPKTIKNYCYMLQFTLTSSIYGLIEKSEILKIESEFDNVIEKSNNLDELKQELLNLLLKILEDFIKLNNKEIPNEKIIVEKAKDYIKANYSKKITLYDISEEICLSPNYFSVVFKKITGETYIDYLQKIRMMAAKKMLEDRTKKVYEIAFEIGYSDYKYFTSKFKKIVGISPKEYRKNIQKQLIDIE